MYVIFISHNTRRILCLLLSYGFTFTMSAFVWCTSKYR